MPPREQVFLEILDPKGTAFYKCGQRKYEKLLPALSTVHSTRLTCKGKRTFQLKHGPQDLGCKSYTEVLQLFRLLGKGLTFADALGRATGINAEMIIRDISPNLVNLPFSAPIFASITSLSLP